MRALALVSTVLAALVVAVAAQAGGWATVQLASPPEGVGPGDTWRAELTVLRHGVTPTDGASPVLTIRSLDSGHAEAFPATPTGETGVYAADVVFPEAGRWSYEIDNGLAATGYGESATTTYPSVEIGSVAAAGGEASFPAGIPVALVVALLAVAAAAALGARRLLRPVPLR